LAKSKALKIACKIHCNQSTRMLKKKFIEICLSRQEKQTTSWGQDILDTECVGCKIGALIANGKDFTPPTNVEWIKVRDVVKEDLLRRRKPVHEEKVKTIGDLMVEKELAAMFKELPVKKNRLRLADLRKFWRTQYLISGETGECPNCKRVLSSPGCGVCGSCYSNCRHLKGEKLLDALVENRRRRMATDKVARLEKVQLPAISEKKDVETAARVALDAVREGQPPVVSVDPCDMQIIIGNVCKEVKDILLAKNKAYGNSAADPVRIFSKAGPVEQINVRIDDKLSRLMRGNEYPGDDTELDLIGYLVLKRAVKQLVASK
jgi:hypothetical protein